MLLSGKVTAAPFCLWSCRGRACPARGIAWADVYGVVCRGGIYPSRDACGSGNTRGASGKPAFTGSHRAGHARPLPRGFGADVTRITAVGRHAPMPPKVRVAARLTGYRARPRRRGQDPSLRTNVHGCFVGGGVPDAPRVYGKRAFTGSHRAGHARPLPRGYGADVTCITAVGRHAPMPPKVRVAARLTGCRARSRRRGQDPSLRTNFHGCFVGSGLDRSVPVCGNGSVHGKDTVLTPSPPQFPRPSGSCGQAAAPRRLRAESSPSNPDPAIGRTYTRCASPSPSF